MNGQQNIKKNLLVPFRLMLATNKTAIILTVKTADSLILELKVKLNACSNFYAPKFATTLMLPNPVLFAVCSFALYV